MAKLIKRTKDGLPIVTGRTFFEFLENYPISAKYNDPEVTQRIESENPQIYRLLSTGMNAAPNKEAKAYYECGMQIVYELLRRQSRKDKSD